MSNDAMYYLTCIMLGISLVFLTIGLIVIVLDISIGKKWTEIFKGDERDE